MRSWMIGMLLGILPVAMLERLPQGPVPLALVFFALAILHWRHHRWARLCCGIGLGSALAISHGQSLLQRRLPQDCTLLPLTVSGEVSSLPSLSLMPDGSPRQRFEFLPDYVQPGSCAGPGRLLLSYYGPRTVLPGEHWRFEVRLKRPWGLANPGSFNRQAWYALHGIDAVGSVRSGAAKRLSSSAHWLMSHQRLRYAISSRIAELPLESDVRAILRAITVADKSGIDHRLWNLLQRFGINHLLVISGLHVGLVAGLGYLAGGVLLRPLLLLGLHCPWLPGGCALVLGIAYTALADFSLATQRALCMLSCFILAAFVGRRSSAVNNLLLAAVLVLCLNPLAGIGSGFWLSFGAVAALLWLGRLRTGTGAVWRLLLTHGFMSLVMLPVGAWWFGGASAVSALANFIMIPLIGIVVVPLALLGAFAYCCGWAVAEPLWRVSAWPLQRLLSFASGDKNVEEVWFYWYLSAGLEHVLVAGLGVLLLVVPSRWPVKVIALVALMPLLVPAVQQASLPPDLTRLTVLDVGQGTAIVIRAGGRTLLYDTGGGNPAGANMATLVILPYLRGEGVRTLDAFIVSHPDADHSAGAAAILRAMPVARLYYGGQPPVAGQGRPCLAGQAWQWPTGQRFRFLSPAREYALPSNDSSCVLQIETAGGRLLLAGDIERDREQELVRYWGAELDSDWLLLPHHGSRTSSSTALLKHVTPRVMVVNSGYANRFGHPHQEVVQRVKRTGGRLDATASGGSLEYDLREGEPLRVRTYREKTRRYWM